MIKGAFVRNILAASSLLALFLFAIPIQTRAACGPQAANGVCAYGGMSACPGSTAECCDSLTECSGGSAPPPSGSQNTQATSGNSTGLGQSLCGYIQGDKRDDCDRCDGVWTDFGCINSTPAGFLSKMIQIGVSLAGGIAFLLILFGGFQILTSAGNPEQLNAGRELISSAVAGLLFIIFSLFLLRLIGFNILRIPGFG